MERDALIGQLQKQLRSHPEISAAYLFGSVALGVSRTNSDVDLAVLLTNDPPRTLAGLGFDLRAAVAAAVSREIDLVILNRAPADLIHRVLRDGILLLERDRSARIRFEVRARNEYLDLKPALEAYRRAVLA
jgi:predicted nucleotidyltransferase